MHVYIQHRRERQSAPVCLRVRVCVCVCACVCVCVNVRKRVSRREPFRLPESSTDPDSTPRREEREEERRSASGSWCVHAASSHAGSPADDAEERRWRRRRHARITGELLSLSLFCPLQRAVAASFSRVYTYIRLVFGLPRGRECEGDQNAGVNEISFFSSLFLGRVVLRWDFLFAACAAVSGLISFDRGGAAGGRTVLSRALEVDFFLFRNGIVLFEDCTGRLVKSEMWNYRYWDIKIPDDCSLRTDRIVT